MMITNPGTASLPTRQSLTRPGCLALLAPGGHGRVAATIRAVPVIIPVSFSLCGEDVVFTPGPGEGLAHAVSDAVVAFESDEVGAGGLAGWVVHVTGVARPTNQDTDEPWFRLASDLIIGWRVDV